MKKAEDYNDLKYFITEYCRFKILLTWWRF